jgi:hypothetical protein
MKRTQSIQLLTKPEAARRAGVGLRQIRIACDRGELAEYRIGAWPRVCWHEVLSWIERQRVRPADAADR